MKTFSRRLYQVMTVAVLVSFLNRALEAQENGETYRWDIVAIRTIVGVGDIGGVRAGDSILNPGGTVVAAAPDGTTLTLTGSGLFQVDETPKIDGPRIGQTASGGGTWILRGPPPPILAEGEVLSGGTYTAIELIHFQAAPGRAASDLIDSIGQALDLRAGLMILKVRFSDGAAGTLTFHTSLAGTPSSIPSLVRVTKGAIEYSASATEAIHLQR